MTSSTEPKQRVFARAPVRVDPAGGGTDAPPFQSDHGGWVINFSVSRHAYVSAERLPPGQGVVICSLDLGQGVVADSVESLAAQSRLEFLRAFVQRLVAPEDSFLLVTEASVPAGSGLGGSGAIGVAVVAAIERAYGRRPSPGEIAALANEIERKDLGYPGGSQDSFGAALGGMNYLEHRRDGSTVPADLRVDENLRMEIERASLLIYSGAAHNSGSIHDDIRKAYAEDSPTRRAMFSLRDAAQAMAEALRKGDLQGYLEMLNAACDSLYDLHPSCGSEEHDRYVEALGDRVLARKTCGAGGGGFLLVHTRDGQRSECMREVERLGGIVWPLNIDDTGVTTWFAEPTSADELKRLRGLAGAS